jgi:hypothetical protein
MLAGYLIAHEGLSPKEAIKEVKQSQTSQESRDFVLRSPYQRAYLENPAFPDNPGWKEPEVFIPPPTSPCFGSSEGGTKTEPLESDKTNDTDTENNNSNKIHNNNNNNDKDSTSSKKRPLPEEESEESKAPSRKRIRCDK